jgi:hypothetical protein
MRRANITRGLITSLVLAASLQAPSLMAFSNGPQAGRPDAGGPAQGQECRAVATAATTTSKGPGFTAEIATTCQHDKATNQSTCTNKYADSMGTSTSTVSVTTFASTADLVDEVKVIPPRRRSLRTDTTATNPRGSSASSVVNTYDAQNRLAQEVGESPGGTFTTTYTSWDEAGRPTAGKTVTSASINSLTLEYNDKSRTLTTTTDSGGQKLVCTVSFDVNGNPAVTSCKGPGGMGNGSTTTTTATERVCR